ncbi:MAG TPA: radical SAM protein [Candidatus Bathyarchaeia archaeon]|nr:radical SAM protein [Candidatus Bathyarchaeia archaeon]
MKKRALVVNCYFDDHRGRVRRPWKLPYAMGPVYLAGAFSEDCEIRLYNEVSSGPLEDARLLGWPDMLVLTGLTNGFDRMLHLAAYARTRNPRVIVVAGGPAIRALPVLSRSYFDYACTGDIEELREVIREAWGPAFAADEMLPRYDLAGWIGSMGHAEASRACNFLCSFCSLTGEGGRYQSYPIEHVRRQIVAMGRKKRLFFVDNNFYGADRRLFEARVDLVDEMRQRGYFTDWGALVTNDFFYAEENLEKVRRAGCTLLFSGVESFDRAWLQEVNKLQNLRRSPVDMIARCLERGIMFAYGLILDVTTRRLADLRRELDFVVGTPEIPLPGFLTLPIPLLATPFFRECLATGAFLPLTRLRDMDGSTLVLRTLDPLDEVAAFVRGVMALRGYRRRALRHAVRFAHRYRSALSLTQLTLAMGSTGLLCAEGLITRRGFGAGGRLPRTHVTSTEVLDPMYTPAFRVGAQYERHFRPTMVTDSAGNLTEDLAELASSSPRRGSPGRGRSEAQPAWASASLTTGAG